MLETFEPKPSIFGCSLNGDGLIIGWYVDSVAGGGRMVIGMIVGEKEGML